MGERFVAPLGNKFWLLRSSHGRNPIFATPQDLWDAACQYFEWVEANPLKEDKAFSTKDDGIIHTEINLMRAMTIGGMCVFIGISKIAWFQYSRRKGFVETCAEIDEIIRSQKFAGAAAGLLNAAIIARDLGLVEKTDSVTTINKGTGWDEVFAQVGNKSRALTHEPKQPVVIEHQAEPVALKDLN